MGTSAAKVMGLTILYAKASVLYLAAGITMLVLIFSRILLIDIFAFFFMQLYGFVAMMIFGVSYLFIPAFSHTTLYSIRLARWQFLLFNLGTIGLTVGFSGYVKDPIYEPLQLGALLIQAVAIYLHAFNVWKTASGWKGSPGENLARIPG